MREEDRDQQQQCEKSRICLEDPLHQHRCLCNNEGRREHASDEYAAGLESEGFL